MTDLPSRSELVEAIADMAMAESAYAIACEQSSNKIKDLGLEALETERKVASMLDLLYERLYKLECPF